MNLLTVFALIVPTIVIVIYAYLRYTFTHWKRKKVPYLKPTIPWGNLSMVARRKTSFGINLMRLYESTKEPIVGIYLLFRPALLVRDPELVKKVLAADFNSFHDRGIFCNAKIDPLSETLFAMPGRRWKVLRTRLSPTFTSGKLKGMLPTIMAEGKHLQTYLEPMADNGEVVDMKDILSR